MLWQRLLQELLTVPRLGPEKPARWNRRAAGRRRDATGRSCDRSWRGRRRWCGWHRSGDCRQGSRDCCLILQHALQKTHHRRGHRGCPPDGAGASEDGPKSVESSAKAAAWAARAAWAASPGGTAGRAGAATGASGAIAVGPGGLPPVSNPAASPAWGCPSYSLGGGAASASAAGASAAAAFSDAAAAAASSRSRWVRSSAARAHGGIVRSDLAGGGGERRSIAARLRLGLGQCSKVLGLLRHSQPVYVNLHWCLAEARPVC